jgi:hypothetical protein
VSAAKERHNFLIGGFRRWRELAELKDMVRLGACLPGDEQRIVMVKRLLTQWHVLRKRRAESHAKTHERRTEVRLNSVDARRTYQ